MTVRRGVFCVGKTLTVLASCNILILCGLTCTLLWFGSTNDQKFPTISPWEASADGSGFHNLALNQDYFIFLPFNNHETFELISRDTNLQSQPVIAVKVTIMLTFHDGTWVVTHIDQAQVETCLAPASCLTHMPCDHGNVKGVTVRG